MSLRLRFQRKRRWLKRAVMVALAGITLAAALMLVVPVFVQAGLNAAFKQSGFHKISYDRLRLGLTSAEMEGLSLNHDSSVRVARITARYSLGDLLLGRVDQLEVSGLDAAVHLGADGLRITDFTPPPPAKDAGASPNWPFRRLTITDSRVQLEAPLMNFSSQLIGQADRNPDGTLDWVLSLTAKGLPVTYQLQLAGEMTPAPDGLRHVLKLSLPLVVSEAVAIENLRGAATGTLQNFTATLQADAATLLGFGYKTLRVTAQQAGGVVTLTGASAPAADPAQAQLTLDMRRAEDHNWRGAFRLESAPARANIADAARGHFIMALEPQGTSLRATLDVAGQNFRLPQGGRLQGAALKAQAEFPAGGGVHLRGRDGESCARLRLDGVNWGYLRLRHAGLCAEFSARAAQPVIMAISGLTADGTWQGQDNVARALELGVRRLHGQMVPAAGASPAAGQARIEDLHLQFPEAALTLRAEHLGLTFGPVWTLTLPGVMVESRAAPALFAPLRLTAEVSGTPPQRLALTGAVRLAEGPPRLTLDGAFQPAINHAKARLHLPALTLGPAFPLEKISPALAAHWKNATGTVTADATLRWKAGTLSTQGALELSQLSAEAAGVAFGGLTTRLSFQNLWPPVLQDGQELRIKRLSVGLPLTDLAARFGLRADGKLFVASAEAQLAGGTLTLAPLRANLAGGTLAPRLTLDKADLAQFLSLVPLEGLSGDGRLSGSLPLKVHAGVVTLNNGELRSESGGRLRYDPASPPAFLSSGEPNLQRLRQFLTDFEYEQLTLGLRGRIPGALELGLKLEGANPAVEGGRAVKLNLNVTGDLPGLLRQQNAIQRLPETLMRTP